MRGEGVREKVVLQSIFGWDNEKRKKREKQQNQKSTVVWETVWIARKSHGSRFPMASHLLYAIYISMGDQEKFHIRVLGNYVELS